MPSQWYQVVREASINKPFEVIEMQQEDFLDFKGVLAKRSVLRNKDKGGKHFLLREMHWLNFGWGTEMDAEGNKAMIHHPYEVWMGKSFSSEEPWIKVRIIRNETSEGNIVSDSPPALYQGPITFHQIFVDFTLVFELKEKMKTPNLPIRTHPYPVREINVPYFSA